MKRLVCCVLIAAVLPVGRLAAYEYAEVTLDYVAAKAQQRAQKPFHSPRADLPDFLHQDKLDYDKYRLIEFRHENALWATEPLPFRVEFFHPGYIYQEPIHVNEFTLTHVQPIRFVQDWFNYRPPLHFPKQIPTDVGYAGFRVLYPLNQTDKWDELGAFIGASYFRLLGKGQVYGQSARGLALDSGETDRPEEFPIFTDWWLGKPSQGEDRLKMYAILDSVSCVGAYKFVIIPGDVTVVDIEAILYFRDGDKVRAVNPDRKPIKTIGMAPLTSMFWFGKASEKRFDDYRPEVHDTDGLLMQLQNEVLWRPLINPAQMSHQVFATKSPGGFGLIQRERNFSAYEDLFNHYSHTPSVWVRPNGDWGEGQIHLVELPTTYEGLDNIVAFWNPKDQPEPMKPYHFSYTLLWGLNESDMKLNFDKARVISTRVGLDPRDNKVREFAIDFAGPKLKQFTETNKPQAISSCSANAGISFSEVYYNPNNGSWRVVLKLEPKSDNKDPVDIRCTLQKGEEVLSETWTYHWSPP